MPIECIHGSNVMTRGPQNSAPQNNGIIMPLFCWYHLAGIISFLQMRPSGSFWMTCYGFGNPFAFSLHGSGNKIRQTVKHQTQCKIPAENWQRTCERLVRTHAHLETVCDILQFPKRHQRNKTASYKSGGGGVRAAWRIRITIC